jgi:hypothetical protein
MEQAAGIAVFVPNNKAAKIALSIKIARQKE